MGLEAVRFLVLPVMSIFKDRRIERCGASTLTFNGSNIDYYRDCAWPIFIVEQSTVK